MAKEILTKDEFAEAQEFMVKVADMLSDLFEGYGFALLVYDKQSIAGDNVNFISNGTQEESKAVLGEFAKRLENDLAESRYVDSASGPTIQ